jgi:hypothetical protein
MKYRINTVNEFTKTIATKRVSAATQQRKYRSVTASQRNHIPGGGKSPGIWWN